MSESIRERMENTLQHEKGRHSHVHEYSSSSEGGGMGDNEWNIICDIIENNGEWMYRPQMVELISGMTSCLMTTLNKKRKRRFRVRQCRNCDLNDSGKLLIDLGEIFVKLPRHIHPFCTDWFLSKSCDLSSLKRAKMVREWERENRKEREKKSLENSKTDFPFDVVRSSALHFV